MQATEIGGKLRKLPDCYINVPGLGGGKIVLKSLPDITDNKSAAYSDEAVIGRSFPLKTYSHSENRAIGMEVKLYSVSPEDFEENLYYLRLLESATYPRSGQLGAPFTPPPICQIKCGKILGDDELCVVLKSYSAKFPTDLAWNEEDYMPMRIDVSLSWDVVYKTRDLPGQERILMTGR